MDKEFHVSVLHGTVKASRSGPSYNANVHRLVSLISDHLEQSQSKGFKVHLVVSHAYPVTGNIPSYVTNPERAKAKVKFRATTLNPKTMSQNNPVRMLLKLADDYGVNILYGPVYEVAGPRSYVTTVLIRPDGSLEKYRKITLSPVEEDLGFTRGKEPGIFNIIDINGDIVARIGVFIDEDLFSPMIFEAFSFSKVNLVIGHMMPYKSRFLPPPESDGVLVTMKHCYVDKILTARSIDAGAPLALVGGVLNVYTSGRKLKEKHWMPTTVLDPDDPENEICLSTDTAKNTSRPFLTAEDVDKFKTIVVEIHDGDETKEFDCSKMSKWLRKLCIKNRYK